MAEWFSSQGSPPPKIDIAPSCYRARLGSPEEPALICERIDHEGHGTPGTPGYVYRVLTRLTVYVVRNKKPFVAFDAPIAIDMLDKEEPSGPLFSLRVELREGREIELGEPQPSSCDLAAKELDRDLANARRDPDRDARTAMSAWYAFDRALLVKLCKATGNYAWQKGRFVRGKAAPSPASSSSGF